MIFEPITFPTAISAFPRRAAIKEVTISGVLVPIATIVRPIIASESHAIFARSTAPVTSILPQINRTPIPQSTQRDAFHGESTVSTASDSSGVKLLCFNE